MGFAVCLVGAFYGVLGLFGAWAGLVDLYEVFYGIEPALCNA